MYLHFLEIDFRVGYIVYYRMAVTAQDCNYAKTNDKNIKYTSFL